MLGLQAVRECLRAHGSEVRVLLADQRSGGPAKGDVAALAALARFARDQGATVESVPRSQLDHLSRGTRHQGAAAYAAPLSLVRFDPEDADLPKDALVVALDELEDPQNFGASIRSAVGFGASYIIFPESHAAPLTPSTFRASAGAVEHAKLSRTPNLVDTIEQAKAAGFKVVGLDANATAAIASADLRGRTMMVVGAEGKGLRKPVKSACSELVRLPMVGPVASLNASAALAIALYEVTRQRA